MTEPSEAKQGCGILAGLFVILVVVIAAWGALFGDDSPDLEAGARSVCHQFVEDRLRAPGTADFEDTPQVFDSAPTFRVVGWVDAQNAFGGEVRTPYECTVTHVDGDRYRLVNLVLDD